VFDIGGRGMKGWRTTIFLKKIARLPREIDQSASQLCDSDDDVVLLVANLVFRNSSTVQFNDLIHQAAYIRSSICCGEYG
jgi:hypothetical protein